MAYWRTAACIQGLPSSSPARTPRGWFDACPSIHRWRSNAVIDFIASCFWMELVQFLYITLHSHLYYPYMVLLHYHTYFTHKDYPIMHENPYMITQSIVHITQTRLDNHSKTSRPQPFILPLLECKAIYITDYYPTIRLQLRNHMYYLFKNTQP